MQLGGAQPIEDLRMHGLVALQTCTHIKARAVSFYAELFPHGRAALDIAPEYGYTGADMDHLFDEGRSS